MSFTLSSFLPFRDWHDATFALNGIVYCPPGTPLWEVVILGISLEREEFLIIVWRTLQYSLTTITEVRYLSTYLEPAKSLASRGH